MRKDKIAVEWNPPLSARFLYPPHLHKDASFKKRGLLSGLIISFWCVRNRIP
jgi:hypothetical protein